MAKALDAKMIARDAAARIAEADRQAEEANYAFASGNMAEYWQREAQRAAERVQSEYERLSSGQVADGGSG